MTRFGMVESDFRDLAALLAEAIGDAGGKPKDHWREAVIAFRARFLEMKYCF